MAYARLTPVVAALCLAVAIPTMVVARGVVIFASGPSAPDFPVGKRVGDADRITLRANDRVRILQERGTRELRGPGTYRLAQRGGSSQRSTFAALTEQRSAGRVRTGAVRGDDPAATQRPASLWYVDIARAGTVCLPAGQLVALWRNTAEGEASFALSASEGTSATVTYSDGEILAPWDTVALPITEGATFQVAGHDGAAVGELRFRIMGEVPQEPPALAERLIELGCMQQLEVLVSAIDGSESQD